MGKNMLHLLPKMGPKGIQAFAMGFGYTYNEVGLVPLQTAQSLIRLWGLNNCENNNCPCAICREADRVAKIILEG